MFSSHQVMDSTLSSSSVENVVDQLKAEGQLSPEVAGQLFSSVANKLNSQSDPAGQADRQKVALLTLFKGRTSEEPCAASRAKQAFNC